MAHINYPGKNLNVVEQLRTESFMCEENKKLTWL
jgi:hypothetical protein